MNSTGLHVVSAASFGPMDTAVTVGSSVTFSCTCTAESSDLLLLWTFTAIDVVDFEYLRCEHSSDDKSIAPKCSITLSNNSRTSSLAINDVQLTDAGLYECTKCYDKESSEHKIKARLSVIGEK